MTQRQIESRVAAGLLVPVHRAVYRVASAPLSVGQGLLAVSFATRMGPP